MSNYENLLPYGTAVTWDDVYRFTSNNGIGRRHYQPFLNKYLDAGKCLGALADSIGGKYFPGNYWKAVYDYGLTEQQYFASIHAIANDLVEQGTEPYEYWEFVVNNCYAVLKEAFVDDIS